MFLKLRWIILLLLISKISLAEEHQYATGPAGCDEMEVWDYSMAMCTPRPMGEMSMRMLMVHGNSFFMQTLEEKPRGRDVFTVPNMFMVEAGSSFADYHYVSLDFMGTVEKWTYPGDGTPEFFQIGENKQDGSPFLDAQHPHSSPIMGLTLSDTIAIGKNKELLKISFAPRGESTDGPIAFMHRPTGMVNPDAPLGHHVGQDVGHISSTVVAVGLHLPETVFEISTFNGTEPLPTAVDLPMGTPNSYAARITQQFSDDIYAMGSAAIVHAPEPNDPILDHLWRYSASVYTQSECAHGWAVNTAFIWGLINNFDQASALNSFAQEMWFHKEEHNIWSRLEVLQRTPTELALANLGGQNEGRWVSALTLGYTHDLKSWDAIHLGLGGSMTKDISPWEIQSAYSGDSLAARVFLQVGGMKMWDL